MLKPLEQNSMVAIGTAVGVIGGPLLTRTLSDTLPLGERRTEAIVIPLGIGVLALLIGGGSFPKFVVPFATVQFAYALMELFPGLRRIREGGVA